MVPVEELVEKGRLDLLGGKVDLVEVMEVMEETMEQM